MTTETLGGPMAGEKSKTLSVKLPADVVESVRIVAAYRGETITDLLGNLLRPLLAEMEQKEVARRTKTSRGKEPPER